MGMRLPVMWVALPVMVVRLLVVKVGLPLKGLGLPVMRVYTKFCPVSKFSSELQLKLFKK